MTFTFTTEYNQKALAAMARVLRKTVRRKHSRRSHILGWMVVILGLLLSLPLGKENFTVTFKTILTWIAIAVMILVLVREDAINGYIARKRGLPQMTRSVTEFSKDSYRSSTEVGTTEFYYENIVAIAETTAYFVFLFSKSHAQVYDKSSLSGGSPEAFREFIQKATGCTIEVVK